jgi:hypothetical protein
MCYNRKCSEKGALSGHVIQLSIKSLTSKFGKWINPILFRCLSMHDPFLSTWSHRSPILSTWSKLVTLWLCWLGYIWSELLEAVTNPPNCCQFGHVQSWFGHSGTSWSSFEKLVLSDPNFPILGPVGPFFGDLVRFGLNIVTLAPAAPIFVDWVLSTEKEEE